VQKRNAGGQLINYSLITLQRDEGAQGEAGAPRKREGFWEEDETAVVSFLTT